jgi:cardiolipin synthase A/B
MLRNKLAVVALILSSCIIGCGGSTTSTSAPPAQAGATLSGTALSLSSTVGSTSTAGTITLSNTGSATLTGIVITLGGTNASSFAETNTCGTSLNAGASCTIAVTFTPAAAANYTATVTVASDATSGPQTITVTGAGTASTAPAQAVLSATTIAFGSTSVNGTSSVMSVTLSNPGGATLSGISIALAGTNASNFAETSTCGATLTASSSCTISATFSPTAASTYAATINVTTSLSATPQAIALTGTGTAVALTHTLYAFPETDNSVTPLYALINASTKTIDMTMYALEDTTFSADLVAACKRGVKVRVILDINDEQTGNTPAYTQLNAQANCSAVWANTAFEATHEKSFIVDNATVAIMSLNLQSGYYSTTRDFAYVENDPADIAAIEATFSADYAAGQPSGGTQGASDFSYTPGLGDTTSATTGLIWSPTTAQNAMVNIIANAKKTLLIENEEMASSASYILSALETACSTNHVTVQIAIVDQSSYEANFTALKQAGCSVHTYADITNGFYVHAKAVVADYGLSTQSVYMGSINYSNASMNNNRELGIYITDPASITAINTTMAADYAGGTAW